MKKILIIAPHFPPSNLAAVHRTRLFAQHLPSFEWDPIVLTVHEKYYEEQLDYNLAKLLPENLRIKKTHAFPATKPRLIGDIGLRGFLQLYKAARSLIREQKIHFLYIPIPSFYVSLLGRWLHQSTGILYGIDYIDPWVHTFAGSDKIFSRHWFSTKVATFLEPIAVKKASLITGVAEGYYRGVRERNQKLVDSVSFAAMPYGGEKTDHEKVIQLKLSPYLFQKKQGVIQLVYAGAMLPKAHEPLKRVFSIIASNTELFSNVEFHFIGTGKSPMDANGFNIKPYAQHFGIWQKQVFEYPLRIPYMDVLIHLEASDGVFILGSTEPHYTPSKVYQAVLSKKPVLAVLHSQSSACEIIRESGAGIVLDFNGEDEIKVISEQFLCFFKKYVEFVESFDYRQVKQEQFEKFSARAVTAILAEALNRIII